MVIRNDFKPAVFILLHFLYFFSLSYAANEPAVGINSSSVYQIISVSKSSLPGEILPYYEYVSYVSVYWAVPSSSLADINSNNVTVYVKAIISQSNDSGGQVYFKDAGKKLNISYAVLTCRIEGANCSASSELEKISHSLFM